MGRHSANLDPRQRKLGAIISRDYTTASAIYYAENGRTHDGRRAPRSHRRDVLAPQHHRRANRRARFYGECAQIMRANPDRNYWLHVTGTPGGNHIALKSRDDSNPYSVANLEAATRLPSRADALELMAHVTRLLRSEGLNMGTP